MPTQKRSKRNKAFPRRKASNQVYRKRFVLSIEGQTETQYFQMLNKLCENVILRNVRSGTQSAPLHVLKRMQQHIRYEPIQRDDECWLVVDRNQWPEKQLKALYDWSKSGDHFGLAVSNPKFEYWLLLHFEDGNGVRSPADCTRRLRKHIPDYDGTIERGFFTIERIRDATKRANNLDRPRCIDWPRCRYNSTVYRLVERILASEKQQDGFIRA